MDTIPSEMLRGHIDTIILLSLLDNDKHTNQIKEEIEQRASGEFVLKQGTFYSCLQRIVKQGYVKEYRTSSNDGVRRKFYQLTEKGKVYIDQNKDKWAYSRRIIDTLIKAPEETEKAEEPIILSLNKAADEAFDEQIARDDDFSPEVALEQFLSTKTQEEPQITSVETKVEPTKVEPSPILQEKVEEKAQEETKKFEPEQIEIQATDLISQTEKLQIEEKTEQVLAPVKTETFFEDKTQPEKVDVEIHEDEIIEKKDVFVETSPNHSPSKIFDLFEIDKKQQEQTHHTIVDDSTSFETAATVDYKSVLSKILPKHVETPKDREIIYTDDLDLNEFFSQNSHIEPQKTAQIEEKQIEIEHKSVENKGKKLDKKAQKAQKFIKKVEETQEKLNIEVQQSPKISNPYFDFSEIENLAEEEGFKVRISTSSNVKDVSRIRINKLVFHASLTYFVILAIETLLLWFSTASIANLDLKPYLIFMGICLLFPLFTGVAYLLNPSKKVSKISTFKSVIELILIISLNLVLILIVCCVLTNLDFSNQELLVKFILYPILLILNLPIYPFIKYLLLDKSTYFS